ncbi:MAG: adenylate/guanylate cyclase domain-containing protein [Hyphomicrobiales bacterium]|nr:adenylate/guanylate cyclase domain-containing protein [Hyphomicrobiales bacterium]
MKRKLTTIFCADVQNYSAMMATDEAATMNKLERYRKIMDDLFVDHEGRMVNTWGDAVIGEFGSVVEAVRCAVEIQDAIGAENLDLPKKSRMQFRIGINLGDVMDKEGDLYGDGVNIAARLEALCDPGGIMVSENVYRLSHKQLAVGYDFAGKHRVKEGEDPIAGYRVRIGGKNQPETPNNDQPEEIKGIPFSSGKPGYSTDNRLRGIFNKAGSVFDQFLQWYPGQSKRVKLSVFMIGFFAAINILFTGIATPWFIFPSAPFALHILIKLRSKK